MNNCTAIGVFKNGALRAFAHSPFSDATALSAVVHKALKRWLQETLTIVYSESGLLVCTYAIKMLIVVVCTAEDSLVANKLLASRVEKALKDADFRMSIDFMTQIDQLAIGELGHKLPFNNKSGSDFVEPQIEEQITEVSLLPEKMRNRQNESATLELLFSQLKFEFLKDEPAREFGFGGIESFRAMEEKTYEKFLVNLEDWDSKPTKEPAVRISMGSKDRSSYDPVTVKAHPISRMRPSNGIDFGEPLKAKILVEEKLTLKVAETSIKEKFLHGKTVLVNFALNCDFSITPLSPEWNDPAKIDKRKFAALESLSHSETSAGFFVEVPPTFEGRYLPLYEYIVNPLLISNDTIPFYIAYMKQRDALLLKFFFNKRFQGLIKALKFTFELSQPVEESDIESSHVGKLSRNLFVSALTDLELSKDAALAKFSVASQKAMVIKVDASCVIPKNLMDLDFGLTSSSTVDRDEVERKLEVEYALYV